MTEDTVSEITYTNNITVEEYNKLRKSVDWILVTEKRAAIALGNTFYLCVAMVGEEPVGMVRVVLDYIQKDVMEGETVMVSLMSAFERETFYQRFGFHKRPFGNHGSGMSVWVSRDGEGNVAKH